MRDETLTQMQAAMSWVVDALATVDVGAGAVQHFLLADQYIHATDGRMTAACPFPFPGEALVPGGPFRKLVNHMPNGAPTWSCQTADTWEAKQGRFKAKVKSWPLTEWIAPRRAAHADGLLPVTPTFLAALAAVRPFISENATQPWATCANIADDGFAYATNNVALVRAAYRDPHGAGPPPPVTGLLPAWAIDFLLARREGLTHGLGDAGFLTFLWGDGSWMSTRRISATFPEQAAVMLREALTGDDYVPVDADLRRALGLVQKLTDEPVIELGAFGLRGRTGEAVLEVEDGRVPPVPCPEGATLTLWDVRYLAPALGVATQWAPSRWPKPAPFVGPLLSGFILGRAR